MAMLPLNSDMVVMMKTIMMLLQQGGGLTCKGGMSVPQVLRLFLSLSHTLLLLLLHFNSLIAVQFTLARHPSKRSWRVWKSEDVTKANDAGLHL